MNKNSQSVIWKIVRKNLASNLGRNVLLILAVSMTTFMVATIINLCVNQIENQWAYTALQYGMADSRIEPIIIVLCLMAVLLLIGGFLLINNVMSLSISNDIRFYGLLKSIGTTHKQIQHMILQQVLCLCAIGIPLGLSISVIASRASVSLFLSMYSQFSTADYAYSISFHPLVFIGASIFTLITAMIGAFKPSMKAARISPIEAVRFFEYGYSRKKTHSSAFSPVKMAWRNVFRVPRRTIPVFCGLFLGMTIFLAFSVILGSANVETFVETAAAYIKGDIYLQSNNRIGAFSPEYMDKLKELPGLNEMRVHYFQSIEVEITDTQGEVYDLSGFVYGLDKKGIGELSKELGYSLDETAFENGEFVVVREIFEDPQLISDSVKFIIGNTRTPISFKIGGILPSSYSVWYGIIHNSRPRVYMPVGLLQKLAGELSVYEVELDIERDKQERALQMAEEFTADQNGIVLQTKIPIREEAENILFASKIMSSSISVILWLFGVLNFINISTVSILSRRHEFALLESIGQSRRQSRKILIYEGLIYASVTLLLVGTLGSVLIYVLFSVFSQEFYIKFTFPFYSFFAMVFVIFIICLCVPVLVYHSVCRSSITDRLKIID